MDKDSAWFQDRLIERLVRYAKIHTTSDRHATSNPSTPGQWDLARILEQELRDLGITDVTLDENCNLIARLRAPEPVGTPIGFLAHLDTAPDFSGEGVNPQIHENYDGGVIRLNDEHTLDPADYPMLGNYVGKTVITTDGTTLLGADDKAGIAEIMTTVEYLIAHPEIPRPDIEVAFTPDEETGSGLETFPVDALESKFCFTLDGTDEGGIEAECFTAYKAVVTFTGYSIHPGSARGKLANAVTMASYFISSLPRSESPEATDGRFGFYCPAEVRGSIASATAEFIIRDFDRAEVDRRLEFFTSLAKTTEAAFPGGKVAVEFTKQYVNMADFLRPYPEILESMKQAVRHTGMEPHVVEIRGGTDGARLSERGVPTPNLFTGGQNLHGRYEWIAASAMERATKSAIHLVELLAQREDSEA
jgi:tripeptide aminopeptidase